MVSRQGDLQPEHAAALARLLKEHGEVLALAGGGDARAYYVQAFLIYDE